MTDNTTPKQYTAEELIDRARQALEAAVTIMNKDGEARRTKHALMALLELANHDELVVVSRDALPPKGEVTMEIKD